MTPDVLIVIPTYNERANLRELLGGIRTHVPDADILVVDDGSPDGTSAFARELNGTLGHIDVLDRPGRGGIGSAYRDGFRLGMQRGYRRLVSMDADLSHGPEYLPALIAATADADLAIGSRYQHGVSVVNWTLLRLALSVGANAYARAVTGMPVHDCTSGFQCFRREVLEAIGVEHLRLRDYAFLIEFKYRAFRHGFRLAEVPIIFVERREGESKNGLRTVVRTMLAVLTMRVRR
jgi:dolichol-phosphate mannosyltransferase